MHPTARLSSEQRPGTVCVMRYLTVDGDGTTVVVDGPAPLELTDLAWGLSALSPSVIVERVGAAGTNPYAACLRGGIVSDETHVCNVYRLEPGNTDPEIIDMSDADITAVRETLDRFRLAHRALCTLSEALLGKNILDTKVARDNLVCAAVSVVNNWSDFALSEWGGDTFSEICDVLDHFRLDDGSIPVELAVELIPEYMDRFAIRALLNGNI